mmetsp:Transcript_58243/g.161150  ORF Transcript_58243/g.161150 Transcript_58243/m.161150 type:complete len:106 (+) Transcript_58243:265-582(+)
MEVSGGALLTGQAALAASQLLPRLLTEAQGCRLQRGGPWNSAPDDELNIQHATRGPLVLATGSVEPAIAVRQVGIRPAAHVHRREFMDDTGLSTVAVRILDTSGR